MVKSVSMVLLSCVLVSGCALQQKKIEKSLEPDNPINCATAKADMVTLQDEKVSAAARASAGARSIIPIGLVAGIVSGTAGTKARVASGKYNEMIEARIAQIEQTCGVTAPALPDDEGDADDAAEDSPF